MYHQVSRTKKAPAARNSGAAGAVIAHCRSRIYPSGGSWHYCISSPGCIKLKSQSSGLVILSMSRVASSGTILGKTPTIGKGSCNFVAIACKRRTKPYRKRSSNNSGRLKSCVRASSAIAPDRACPRCDRNPGLAGPGIFHQRSVLRYPRLHSRRSAGKAILETRRFPLAGHPQVPSPLRLAAPRQADGPHRIGLPVEGRHGGDDRVPGIGHAKPRQSGGAADHLPQRHRTEEGRAGLARERADAAGHAGVDRRRHPGRHGRRQGQTLQRALRTDVGLSRPN